MKRNMDLVRSILLEMEKSEHGYCNDEIIIDGYNKEEIGYHVYLMIEAGLLVGVVVTTARYPSPFATQRNLTWAGHEFIESSRNSTIWEQSKEIVNKVGGASIGIWTEVLKQTVLNNLGLGS